MMETAERVEPTARMRIRRKMFEDILSHLNAETYREAGAYLACDTFMHGSEVELLVRDFDVAAKRGMQLSARHISAHPGFIAGAVNYAGQTRGSVIAAHIHPFADESVPLTQLDREGEAELLPRLQKRIPYAHHGTIIFGRRGAVTRFFRPNSSRPITAELIVED